MHSIKKILLRLIIVFLFVLILESGLRFIYEPNEDYSQYRKIELEENKGEIEMVFCGTSRTMKDYNPQIFDKKLNTNSFNLGTGQQPISITYYYLKEIIEKNPIEVVFLEVSPTTLCKDSDRANDTPAKLSVYDRLFNWKTKIISFFDIFPVSEYEEAILYSTNIESLFDFEFIKSNVNSKLSNRYEDGLKGVDTKSYKGKGHVSGRSVYKGAEIGSKYIEKKSWEGKRIQKKNVKFLNKIIQMCLREGIEINLVTVPVNPKLQAELSGLDEMNNYYLDIASHYSIDYYNFYNYRKKDNVFLIEYFSDFIHMNEKGTEIFSNYLIDIYLKSKCGEELEKFFVL
ncbi:SGNH/GDSL hydrolase family protein [Anaerosacchariphilus polymeriproducens]|uniref:SGNH/GDSL hydrolase family protein n=1 Tax=Anaerosacchariphilus polymeriproducens TaxID=1812858 RepID=A0A371AT19_9FIRM|nr:SGNH/GDSL hydrolase family protein [Anaerosacchariphilus polymeriproducens]RDU22699.1 SGNH/GDSL hydrolase family protein [Anaerosacchariphilus polymeriproducens]